MSILLKWKNKLQDPALYETKIREFDERVSLLKSENVELHKRIDQLEALCTTSVDTPQTRCLQEHVQQLEQENGRLFVENQCQRQEYEGFLEQLTTMIVRTAMMHENIRKECASIYHVIERLSTLTANAIQADRTHRIEHRVKHLRSLSWESLQPTCDLLAHCQLLSPSPRTTAEFIRHLCRNRSSLSPSTSSSSCSSATTHCSFSTSGSWTLDLPLYHKNADIELPLLPITNGPTECPEEPQQQQRQQEQGLHRSETFTIVKVPPEEPLASASSVDPNPKTTSDGNLNSNIQRCPLTRAMASTTPTAVRPSRLPSRCSISRQSSTPTVSSNVRPPSTTPATANRSLSAKKASKLPVRTATSLTKQVVPVKKSNVPTPVATKTRKDSTVPSTRAVASAHTTMPTAAAAAAKRTIRPPMASKSPVAQAAASKPRSRSITTVNSTAVVPISGNKRTRTTPPVVKKGAVVGTGAPSDKLVQSTEAKAACPIEQMNSTSSESSIEENQRRNKLLAIVQDEGYSTWSSSDVKEESTSPVAKKNETDERRRSTGLVKSWLDTTNKRCSTKPVTEEVGKLEEFTRELPDGSSMHCPFVRNRCSNGIIIPLASTTLSSAMSPAPAPLSLQLAHLNKDISVDSLDAAAGVRGQQKESIRLPPLSSSSSSASSSTFSRSETFEKLLVDHSLPIIVDDLADSTDSTCSDVNPHFNMSEYIEDSFLDQAAHAVNHSSPLHPVLLDKMEPVGAPQKRLMFPGLFNRLIFLRRVVSDSDLPQKLCCLADNEVQFHVYHSNTINEHSIELNLMNTYGSDSELHVWSHDCAEQRRFANERQQQLLINSKESKEKLSHIERMIRMSFDDNAEDDSSSYELDSEEYDQQLALERQTLLQQIYEYPWLLQEDDIDQTAVFPSPTSEQPLLSPSPDLVVPSHNPDFYQLCALTNSSSFATSFGTNSRHTTPPIAPSVL